MNIEPLSSLDEILPVLMGCNLPVADISAVSPPQFFGIRVTGVLVAVVGLELFQSTGLLRSLAVSPDFRGRGLGQELVAFAEAFAASHGARSLFRLCRNSDVGQSEPCMISVKVWSIAPYAKFSNGSTTRWK